MKNIKIIIFILFVIIVICLIVVMAIKNKNNDEEYNYTEPEDKVIITKKIEKLNSSNDLSTIINCINVFFDNIQQKNKIALFDTLDKEYIEKNNITENNILDNLIKFNNNPIYVINNIYVVDEMSIQTYYIDLKIRQEGEKTYKPVYLTIMKDLKNETFCIIPNEYKPDNEYKETETKSIEKNANNVLTLKFMNDQDTINFYLLNYKENSIYDPESAYNILDEEYKNDRFGSLEEYKKYVSNNLSNIENIKLVNYETDYKDGYKEYSFKDNYNNRYTIKETATMDYKIILDNYTIKTENFIKEYNSADIETKIITDIDIFVKMINNKDYKHAYNLLSNGFKNNYFKTQEAFETYVKQKFFDYNEISIKEKKNEGNVYIYTLEIKADTNLSAKTTEKTFIIKLGEGTDFEISFNME